MSESLHTDLILTAFNRAVAICQSPPGLFVHADRGSQHISDAFTTLLERTQAIASLSRRGNPYDNALAEEWLEHAQKRTCAPWSMLCRP
jgi:transposase InsO family protein